MNRFTVRLCASLALMIVLLSTLTAVSQTRAPLKPAHRVAPPKSTVTKVVAIAKPKSFKGPCPAEIQFVGTIFVKNPPVTVEYQWERSDGATGERKRLEIGSAGEGVYDSWKLGEGKQHMHVWERVHVLSPRNVLSGKASASINCVEPKTLTVKHPPTRK